FPEWDNLPFYASRLSSCFRGTGSSFPFHSQRSGPMIRLFVVFGCLTCLLSGSASAAAEGSESQEMLLRENWFIQSSADVHTEGGAISTVGFPSSGWYPATVPTTVLSALVEDKIYPDPYSGMNLRSIPGTSYPIFEDFSNIMMPPASPFRHSWWY